MHKCRIMVSHVIVAVIYIAPGNSLVGQAATKTVTTGPRKAADESAPGTRKCILFSQACDLFIGLQAARDTQDKISR